MLVENNAAATIAVRDTDAARKFYQDTLGLKPGPNKEDGVLAFQSGESSVLVYKSQFAGTNKATAATWFVGDDIDGIVAELKKKGISFEHYDMPNVERRGDLHIAGDMKAAWFKDPDGNILSLVNQAPR